MKGHEFAKGQLRLYQNNGHLLSIHYFDQSIFKIDLQNLNAEMYFYQIYTDGDLAGNGKIILMK